LAKLQALKTNLSNTREIKNEPTPARSRFYSKAEPPRQGISKHFTEQEDEEDFFYDSKARKGSSYTVSQQNKN